MEQSSPGSHPDQEDSLWDVRIEEDEYVIRLVIDRPCDKPECPCHDEGYETQYEIIARRKRQGSPKPGSLEDRQMKWILGKIAEQEGLGPFPTK